MCYDECLLPGFINLNWVQENTVNQQDAKNTPKQCLNDTGRAVYTPTFPDQPCPGDEAYSVRMQQEHSEKYSVLEQGES